MRNFRASLILSICIFTFHITQSQTTGSISTLNCAGATNNGSLIQGVSSVGVTSVVPYTGGNGGSYLEQSVNSTGVTGLTAKLKPGNFAGSTLLPSSGSLTYTITGTPASSGTASFALNIGGKKCTLTRTVNQQTQLLQQTTFIPIRSCGDVNGLNADLTYGSTTDLDGNSYRTIQIGTQTWMAENLRVRRYRNGDLIPVVTGESWASLNTGATKWYQNDSATYNCPYGKLYNWYAASDPRKLCPTGWHVPSMAEFTTLISFLGGQNISGPKLKSTKVEYWSNQYTTTNSSGFSALPGGLVVGASYSPGISIPGLSDYLGERGNYWSSSEAGSELGFYLTMNNAALDERGRIDFLNFRYGFSVRCVKD